MAECFFPLQLSTETQSVPYCDIVFSEVRNRMKFNDLFIAKSASKMR